MDEVMTDNTLALQISTPVISSCDNVDLKIIFQLIERETKKKQPNEVAAEIELNQTNDQDIIEFPTNPEIKTRTGKKITAPECLTY